MLYVPRHLPNRLEYKVLSCISVHYQSRMTSNEIASTPPYPLTVQAGQYEVGWGYFGSFWMSVLRESCRVCRSSPLVYPTGKLGCRGNYRTSKCTLRAGVMLCVCNYLVNRPPAVLCGPQGVNAAFYYVVETSLNTR